MKTLVIVALGVFEDRISGLSLGFKTVARRKTFCFKVLKNASDRSGNDIDCWPSSVVKEACGRRTYSASEKRFFEDEVLASTRQTNSSS